jgi:hypothetical protein
MACAAAPRRVRVERGIYLQPNGKHAVAFAARAGCGTARSGSI